MPLDPDIAGWMLEFVLRQPDTEDWLANELLFILPLPSRLPLCLHKTVLLRRLAADIRPDRSPSLRTLHSLELLDDLPSESSEPSSASKSMTAAYRAVAVHCVADALRTSAHENGSFNEVFVKNLCHRVSDLERAEGAMLAGEPLRELRSEMEAALASSYARAALVERGTREEALKAVRAFLRDVEEEMGPSFLEMAADVVIKNGIKLVEDSDEVSFESSEEESDLEDYDERACGPSHFIVEYGIDRETGCAEMNREVPSSSAEIVDEPEGSAPVGEEDASDQPESSGSKFDPLPITEVIKVVNDLKSSCSDLKMMVNDPLPGAVKLATEIMKSRMVEMVNARDQRTTQGEVGASGSSFADQKNDKINDIEGSMDQCGKYDAHEYGQEPSGEKILKDYETRVEEGEVAHPTSKAIDTRQIKASDGVPKYTLLDRNPTAHTIEWGDDSIDSSSEKSPALSGGLHLPSPKRRNVSPLKLVDCKKFVKRRKLKRWSLLEEDALRKGVERHGKGNWKTILNCYRDIFEERTEVDLKDKWRNMSRH